MLTSQMVNSMRIKSENSTISDQDQLKNVSILLIIIL